MVHILVRYVEASRKVKSQVFNVGCVVLLSYRADGQVDNLVGNLIES